MLKKKGVHPKIDGTLLNLESEYQKGVKAARMFAKKRNIKIEHPESVAVFLISKPGLSMDETSTQGFDVKMIKRVGNVTKMTVPINMLSSVADRVKGISFVKLPEIFIPLAVESQGVDLIGTAGYHSEGYTGSGVKVAIIDSGFAGLSSAISVGELPADIKMVDCTGTDCVSTDFSSETEHHGTGVAEIIYDMAPDARLYLIKISDTLDLKDAKDYAVDNGIKIINLSGGWFNQNFYDGECYYSSSVCTADDAYANDILWVNAAGNQANQHYEASFVDFDGDGWHNVSASGETINIYAYSGDTIVAYLTWNTWPITDQDYDLYLLNSALNIVASSINSQTGSQAPTEQIYYYVPSTGTYHLGINKYSATSNHQLEVYSVFHVLSPSVGSSSLINPADASGVMTVGGINYSNWTTGPQEYYSSQGPTNDGRIKPDIMGPDFVDNYVYGTFAGTSAASPHVAGAAALILSKNPTLSALQVRDALASLAIDMGSSGKDSIYGHGLVNLDECPSDPNKTEPGICGCGVSDVDTDSDGTFDCYDNCPSDPNKIEPGICGCGAVDFDSDGDGTLDCNDGCSDDPNKIQPGICGCGMVDTDSDGDGILDCEEQGLNGDDPGYDGNDDGIPDRSQSNVTSLHTFDHQNYVTMVSPFGTTISSISAVDILTLNDVPSNTEFSHGIFEFTITGVNIGDSISVTLYFPAGVYFDTFYKYGRTSQNHASHWDEFLYDGRTGAEINGNVITLHFEDGKRGDDDLIANGIIVDVGGPATLIKSSEGESTVSVSSGGGGGGCFIATAAYGSLMAPHVKILRDFRDRFMIGNPAGQVLVHLYYSYSPPLADFIAKYDSMRAVVRVSLLPVVGVCWVTLRLGPMATAVLVFLFGIALIGMTNLKRKTVHK